MIWMDVDAALTEVPVNILPLIDAATAKVIDEGVTYDEAGMDLIWHFETTAGVNTATPVTPTTGGVYDWAHTDGGMYTIEIPASGGASANNDTEGFGYFTGNTTANLPWRGPTIGFRDALLNNLLIDSAFSATRGLAGTALPAVAADGAGGLPVSDAGGLDLDNTVGKLAFTSGTNVDANVIEVSSDSTAADNLEAILDGTGGTGIKVNSIENTGTTTLTGAVSLGSTLGVTGAVTLSSTLGVGAVTLSGLAITNALSVGTTTTLTGAVTLGSTLGVTGATTLASLGVTGALTTGSITNNGTLTQTGNVSLGGTYTVGGVSTHTGAVTYTGGIVADITGDLSGSVGSLAGHTVQTGDSYAIVNHTDHGNAKLVRSTTPANKLDVSATGEVGLDFNNIKDATAAHTLTNITIPTVTVLTGKTGFSVAATGLDLVTKTATFATGMADAVLLRDFSNVEDTAGIDTLCGAGLAALHWDYSGSDLLVYQTDNATLFATITTDTDPDAEPTIQVQA